jgi:hypothetical protein
MFNLTDIHNTYMDSYLTRRELYIKDSVNGATTLIRRKASRAMIVLDNEHNKITLDFEKNLSDLSSLNYIQFINKIDLMSNSTKLLFDLQNINPLKINKTLSKNLIDIFEHVKTYRRMEQINSFMFHIY